MWLSGSKHYGRAKNGRVIYAGLIAVLEENPLYSDSFLVVFEEVLGK